MIYITDELSHHGVKGMKWGVRKQRPARTKKRGKLYIDSYSSAGYKKDGSRGYETSRKNSSIDKAAKERANAKMVEYFGKDWTKIRDAQEIFDTVYSDEYEALERKHSKK